METYALLDSASEVTLCKEQLSLGLGSWELKRDYELQGVTETRKVEGHVIDIDVTSMDNKVSEELTNVRTVEQIPMSSTCIPRKDYISNWPHLRDVELLESSVSDVGLIIGLKETPTLTCLSHKTADQVEIASRLRCDIPRVGQLWVL